MAPDQRATIGIVAGSGPEAGLDLWGKVLKHNQQLLGPAFSGDLDAPRVIVVSEPNLGRSMDLARHQRVVWESLRSTLETLAPQVDVYAIACNTLNWFEPHIEQLGLMANFQSFQSVVSTWVAETNCQHLALLGSEPVADLGPWSAYRRLRDEVDVEVLQPAAGLHQLIQDVKRLGSDDESLRPRFSEIVAGVRADTVLLACTELPLIADIETDKELVDVTDLVARRLATLSISQPQASEQAAGG